MLVEIGRSQGERLAPEKSEVTLRTARGFAQPIARQSNYRVAVSAHYVNAAGHRSPITSVQRRVSQTCPARSQAAGAEGRASARVYRPGALQREKSYA